MKNRHKLFGFSATALVFSFCLVFPAMAEAEPGSNKPQGLPLPSQNQINSRIDATHKDAKQSQNPAEVKPATEPEGTDQTDALDNGQEQAKAENPKKAPDLAYGAYQRGHYLTAFKYALPRAQLGDPAAQTLIGELYEKGLGVKYDPKESAQWFKFAAQNGSREAQFSYALKLLEGKYVPKDLETARELMKKSADAGHSVAQFNYAQMVVEKRPTSRGFEIALGYYQSAAKQGVADAYFAMAQIYARGIGAQGPNENKARKLLVKAAINGVDNAQIELAIWLANGRGGKKDYPGALLWFKAAANKGNVIAQNRLARMLMLGLGTEVNQKEAAKWFVLARRSGHKDSVLNDFFKTLSPKMRKEALDAANRWPSG